MSNIHSNKFGKYYERITELYLQNKTADEIIRDINDPELQKRTQIYKIANRLGISKSSQKTKIKNEKYDKIALQRISDGESINTVAKSIGIDAQALSLRLKKYYSIDILPDGKKKIDSLFFHNINTEEKAYWLGFLMADGYINGKNEIELTLKKQDASHITKFKKAIGSTHKTSSKRLTIDGKEYMAAKVSFKDRQMHADLISHGCINRKSLSIEYPDLCNLEMYRCFVRGYFDGDGTVYWNRNYVRCEFVTGSTHFALATRDYLKEIVKIESSITKDKRSELYHVKILSRDESFLFLKHIYENANIYLDRKYKVYQSYCRLQSILQKTVDDESGIKRGWRKVS
jgi:hypothetical protein